jgi:putative ABC transport system permease protein
MFKIFKIAFNNVLKQKRRTILNALIFAVNTAALVVLIGMLRGMYNTSFDKTIDIETGHFKIYHKKYVNEKEKFPLEYYITQPYRVIESIKDIPYFEGASPRILKNGLLSNYEKKTNVIIMGIDPKKDLEASKLFEKIKGEIVSQDKTEILVGKRLAELMNIKIKDTLLLLSQTKDKANNLVDVNLSGIYEVGFYYIERNIVAVPLNFAQKFFDMEDAATEIIVRIKDKKYVPFVKRKILDILEKNFQELTIRDWTEEAQALIEGTKGDFITYAIVFTILVFLAIFTIMNTLTISVFERIPEIGTLRAIGMSRIQIRLMFVVEGLIIAVIGIFLGWILSLYPVYYMNKYGISMPQQAMDKITYAIDASMKSMNTFFDWVLSSVICFFIGLAGVFLPSLYAAKTDIVAALKRGVR